MAVDPLSPIAPARIRAIVLPVGRVKRASFKNFVDLLRPECAVRLGDVSPDPRPNRTMFSPLAFPDGRLLYDLSTTVPSPSHLSLSPFELFREPLLVIGVADAREYNWNRDATAAAESNVEPSSAPSVGAIGDPHDLEDSIDCLHEQFNKALVHRLLLFNSPDGLSSPHLPEETILVPPAENLKTTTIKTVMCDLTALLLAEMTSLAKSFQALPTINSPASPRTPTAEENKPWSSLPPSLSRRNSQLSDRSRSNSPAVRLGQNPYRMSLPAQLPSSGTPGSENSSRPNSPPSGPNTPPATSFDDMPGLTSSGPVSRSNSVASRHRNTMSQAPGSEKVSVHGFGSGSVSERARNKGKCRIGILIGTLHMCAGRWQDALKELSEHAAVARVLSDHLWHAKALENILVCLLLLAWGGFDFQVPQVCYPIIEKTASAKSPQHTPSNSSVDISATAQQTQIAVQNLRSVLPDLINTILNTYIRAANFSGESLPPLAYSESVIRLSKVLAAVHVAGGSLTEECLNHIVHGQLHALAKNESSYTTTFSPLKADISSLIHRALPSPQELTNMSVTDAATIFVGMSSVLSAASLHRKKALIMKDFVGFLVPALVHARKQGAAEMGIHPAAGLSLSNGVPGALGLAAGQSDGESGLTDFLDSLGAIYGISRLEKPANVKNGTDKKTENAEAAFHTLSAKHALQEFGNLNLKLDILRMCINFCEALPDFIGIVRFTAALLRVAGPGTAPSPNSPEVFVSLAKEEQIRLATTISRTVNTCRKLGIPNIESEYWDDFLVRGLFVVTPPPQMALTKHRRTDLEAVTTGKGKGQNPFIHDPFLKSTAGHDQEIVLVAGDEYEFVVTLQNPYEFEVEIQTLSLAGEGVEFAAVQHNLILGPYRTQRFPLIGVANTTGELRIIGCSIKVKGCREKIFPVFVDPWRPEPSQKMKEIGLRVPATSDNVRPLSGASTSSDSTPPVTSVEPVPMVLTLRVIPPQPLITVSNISLSQSSLMLLEGERSRFSITLSNTSTTTTVDFVHLSFQDSATLGLQSAMGNKDLPMAELHELEVQCAWRPTFRWIQTDGAESGEISPIGPGESSEFVVEILGRPGLLDGVVQFDYGNTKEQVSEDGFFSRQLAVPISVTVNASIQLHRIDVLPFNGDFAWFSKQQQADLSNQGLQSQAHSSTKTNDGARPFLKRVGFKSEHSDHFLVLMDLRNAWPNPLTVRLKVSDDTVNGEHQENSEDANIIEEVIQPGHLSRVVMVLPKLYLTNPHAPITSLNPANQRQFVVSGLRFSQENERLNRECFWYREEVLKRMQGRWEEEGGHRQGEIDLRSIRLSPRMIDAIKLDDISIEMDLLSPEDVEAIDASSEAGSARTIDLTALRQQRNGRQPLRQLGRLKYEADVNGAFTLRTRVHNRSSSPIFPLLRLQPSLAHLPHNAALDLNKKFAWSGLLQQPLNRIEPGESTYVDLIVYALCSGIFEVGATVEEIVASKDLDHEQPQDPDVSEVLDHLKDEAPKRVWHSKEPCTIIAKEFVE